MHELTRADQQAIDRLTIRMLQEIYCSASEAMFKMNPEVAEFLSMGIDSLITKSIAHIAEQHTEGPNSRIIALEVGTRIAEVLTAAKSRSIEAGPLARAA